MNSLNTSNTKKIIIVEKHHEVLYLWEKFKSIKPYILSFDHHTDTRHAFQYKISKDNFDWTKAVKALKNGNTEVISELKHDEHIDTAIKCEFINKALLFTHEYNSKSNSNITNCLGEEAFDNEKRILVNNNSDLNYEDSISIDFENRFDRFNLKIKKDDWYQNFILDIDLDFFHTCKDVQIIESKLFKDLIKTSKAISIARESQIVNTYREKYSDSDISSDFIENRLKETIDLKIAGTYLKVSDFIDQ